MKPRTRKFIIFLTCFLLCTAFSSLRVQAAFFKNVMSTFKGHFQGAVRHAKTVRQCYKAEREGLIDITLHNVLTGRIECDAYILPQGKTILHAASSRGYIYIAGGTLNRGFDVNTKDDVGNTALHCAAAAGKKDMLNLLLDGGANVNAANNYGYTALHVAAYHGNGHIVGILLDRNADVNYESINGTRPLDCALDYQFREPYYSTAHERISDHGGCYSICSLEEALNLHPTADHLSACVSLGLSGIFEFLHKRLSFEEEKKTEIVRLKEQVDRAKQFGLYDGLFENWSPIHAALLARSLPIVSRLCRGDLMLQMRYVTGNTPLLVAAQMADPLCWVFLRMLRADDECQNNEGQTPLEIASENMFGEYSTMKDWIVNEFLSSEYSSSILKLMYEGIVPLEELFFLRLSVEMWNGYRN